MIIVSDMYLSHSDIEDILTGSGYDIKGIPVYVSSEYGLTKRTSSLFKAVLRKEGMEGREKEVLHIGDNLISDYMMARKCGMRSFLYHGK